MARASVFLPVRLAACFAFFLAALPAQGADKVPGYRMVKLSKNLFSHSIEYRTYAQVVAPLKRKLEKGKIEESEFKVEESMMPKGGILAAKLPTADDDPIVEIRLSRDTAQLFVCDDSNQKPGLSLRWRKDMHGLPIMKKVYDDEDKPVMTFECGIKKPLPDTFNLELRTADGEIQGRYGFYKEP
jgi:hypothetical protein